MRQTTKNEPKVSEFLRGLSPEARTKLIKRLGVARPTFYRMQAAPGSIDVEKAAIIHEFLAEQYGQEVASVKLVELFRDPTKAKRRRPSIAAAAVMLGLLLFAPGCATTYPTASLMGRWQLTQAPNYVSGDPVALTMDIQGDIVTISTRDDQGQVLTGTYRLMDNGNLIAIASTPRKYLLAIRRHRLILEDIEGRQLVFTRAEAANF